MSLISYYGIKQTQLDKRKANLHVCTWLAILCLSTCYRHLLWSNHTILHYTLSNLGINATCCVRENKESVLMAVEVVIAHDWELP